LPAPSRGTRVPSGKGMTDSNLPGRQVTCPRQSACVCGLIVPWKSVRWRSGP
jgi:hypothetical protein